MKGCRCCFDCPKHLINRRDEIVPCDLRNSCESYLKQRERDVEVRQAAKAEKDALAISSIAVARSIRRRKR